jgi:DNA polymerase-3 subunit epsilon
MAHFITGKLCLFDLETDAKDPDEAHLVQAAAVHVRPGEDRTELEWIARPRRPIPDEAAGVHGITTERARAEGRDIRLVLDEILSRGLAPWGSNCPLIGHNINYDLTVLDRELHRYHGHGLTIRGPVIDTLLLDKCCDQWRPGSRQLADTARHYGFELVEAHSAAPDALMAGRIAWRMAVKQDWPSGRYGPSKLEREARKAVRMGDAAALHELQIRWYEETQLGLADYFETPKAIEAIERKVADERMTREQGDAAIAALPEDARRCRESAVGGWPVRPRRAAPVVVV